jgi:hypothetical protein
MTAPFTVRRAGVSGVAALVDPGNDPALRFWRAAGYAFDPHVVRYVGSA